MERSTPAFVAGATGYAGQWVVRHLADQSVPTIAHVRPDSPGLARWRKQFAAMGVQVDATPWDEKAMGETLTRLQPGFVFALLGTTRARKKAVEQSGGDPASASYDSVDYGLTALLLRAAVASGAAPRFVYLSAVGVSEKNKSPYYRARFRLETELRESGLPYVIARPSFITGPDRPESRAGERIGAAALDAALGVVRALGAKRTSLRYHSMNGADLGRALVHLALSRESENRVFETEELLRWTKR